MADYRVFGVKIVMFDSRIAREQQTVAAMIGIYCRDRHGTRTQLCADCTELASYADRRLENCPLQDKKTTCAQCPVHCYKVEMREKIKAVMRYAGPRMLRRHPLLAILHMIDGLRKF